MNINQKDSYTIKSDISIIKNIIEIMKTLYSDGCCNKTTGDEGWGSVVSRKRKDMIK